LKLLASIKVCGISDSTLRVLVKRSFIVQQQKWCTFLQAQATTQCWTTSATSPCGSLRWREESHSAVLGSTLNLSFWHVASASWLMQAHILWLIATGKYKSIVFMKCNTSSLSLYLIR
jgi:hypothetical protein